jgi:hypothetical protein
LLIDVALNKITRHAPLKRAVAPTFVDLIGTTFAGGGVGLSHRERRLTTVAPGMSEIDRHEKTFGTVSAVSARRI